MSGRQPDHTVVLHVRDGRWQVTVQAGAGGGDPVLTLDGDVADGDVRVDARSALATHGWRVLWWMRAGGGVWWSGAWHVES